MNETTMLGLKFFWISGLAGWSAGILQVLVFMWLRTVMNVQYLQGGDFLSVFRELWRNGGIKRLYKGVVFALIQTPAIRFGDTAINTGGLIILSKWLPKAGIIHVTALTTLLGSIWRLFLTPIDMLKTMYQVHGSNGGNILKKRVKSAGILTLWSGALAIFLASWIGSYPWFAAHNYLQVRLPKFGRGRLLHHSRTALIGFSASVVSDSVANGVRVLKNIVQTTEHGGYFATINIEVTKDGVLRFATRGLSTRLCINSLQSIFFIVIWKTIEEQNISLVEVSSKDLLKYTAEKSFPVRNGVLIIGASRGIGLQLVKEYQTLGYDVHATYRKTRDLDRLSSLLRLREQEKPKIHLYELEVRNQTQIATLGLKLVDIYNIKIIVHSAGIARGNLQEQIEVNAIAPFRIIDALVPKILTQIKVLCILSSQMGNNRSVKKMLSRYDEKTCGTLYKCSYILSKGKCNDIFRAREPGLRRMGIRSIIIQPGFVATYIPSWNPNPDYSGAISPEESAKGISSLCQIHPFKKINSGKFYDYKGKPLSW